MKAETIITIAMKYVGNHEKLGNSGFVNPEFQKIMVAAGFYTGAPWCAFYTKAVLSQAFHGDPRLPIIKKCCSGSAQQTFKNFKAEGSFKTGMSPKNGALAVWQLGNTASGHIGIVTNAAYSFNTMQTAEGNTNGNGSSEGDQVAMKLRIINRARSNTGLNLTGFVYLA